MLNTRGGHHHMRYKDSHYLPLFCLLQVREARSMAFLNCSLNWNFVPISPADRWRRALVLESYKRSLPWYCVGQSWLSRVRTSNCQSSRRGWTHQPSILETKTYPGNNLCGLVLSSVHEDCEYGAMAAYFVSSTLPSRKKEKLRDIFMNEHS